MAAANKQARSPLGGLAFSDTGALVGIVLKYVGLALFSAMGLIFVYAMLQDNNLGLAVIFGVITIGINLIFLVPGLYPLRWMAPGLALVTLLVIYPIFYTVVTATTNYGDGHRLTKQQAIRLFERQRFVPEDARLYTWDVFQNEDGEYALWLVRELADGSREVLFAPYDDDIIEVEDAPEAPPEVFEDFVLLDRAGRTQALATIQNLTFGDEEDGAAIVNRTQAARPLRQRFVYDSELDALVNQETGVTFFADNDDGVFVPRGQSRAQALSPGFRVNVGLENFQRLIEDSRLLQPLIRVFIWTVGFAALSVLMTFTMGLFMAIILDDPRIPLRKLWRSLIFVPYAIPGVIGILVWRGMLNQNLGLVTNFIDDVTGVRVPWFTNADWARVAILLVNLWLGYPYMMLINSGALQAIPSEIYEAAAVDGARPWQRFWNITLPLLLVTVGPLLIASFVFNFNNYLLIEVLTEGNPPMAGTPTPVGHTDILITYTYSLAFGDRADYGYASAITIIIFAIVLVITLLQFRFTRQWEEVGENV